MLLSKDRVLVVPHAEGRYYLFYALLSVLIFYRFSSTISILNLISPSFENHIASAFSVCG